MDFWEDVELWDSVGLGEASLEVDVNCKVEVFGEFVDDAEERMPWSRP